MKIRELFSKECIDLGIKAKSKEDAIKKAIALIKNHGGIDDIADYEKAVFAREEQGSTGVGGGIAIPHGKSKNIKKAGLAALTIPDGVEFDSLDGQPVKLLILISAPQTADNVHLDILSKLSGMLMNEEFVEELIAADSADKFLEIVDKYESKEDAEDEKPAKASADGEFLIGVTGCPNGIAHTYMAAENLEKAAAKKGHSIKVETRGSGGTKNKLSKDDIEKAAGVIIACDTDAGLDRFDGKKIVVTSVSEGIKSSEKLVDHVLSDKAKVQLAGSKDSSKSDDDSSFAKKGKGSAVYKHLMTGVSHMLPFVIAGGILKAIAFLIDTLMGYGATASANFGSCTPVSALIMYIGGLVMHLMIPVLAG